MSTISENTQVLPTASSTGDSLPRTLKNGPQEGVQYPIKVNYCGGLIIYLIQKNYNFFNSFQYCSMYITP